MLRDAAWRRQSEIQGDFEIDVPVIRSLESSFNKNGDYKQYRRKSIWHQARKILLHTVGVSLVYSYNDEVCKFLP